MKIIGLGIKQRRMTAAGGIALFGAGASSEAEGIHLYNQFGKFFSRSVREYTKMKPVFGLGSIAADFDELRKLLLDLISSVRPVSGAILSRLTLEDWDYICIIAHQHRLEPLLLHQYRTQGHDWTVPPAIESQWESEFRKSAIHSLSIQKTLLDINRILADHDIPYAGLKGSWLALHTYPHPALRPMRDIDIIVPQKRALDAYAALMRHGYSRLPNDLSPLLGAIEKKRHLPPLRCLSSHIIVEVHTRLINRSICAGGQGAKDDASELLSRRIWMNVGETPIPYLSQTDALLHLIVHSAYSHRFNNGPIVMNDIAMMLRKCGVDWELFWKLAETQNLTRGCQLLLAMTRRYHGVGIVGSFVPSLEGIPETIIDKAALMTLQDLNQRGNISVNVELASKRNVLNKLAFAAARIFPTRQALAAHLGVTYDSKRVWWSYPKWLLARTYQVANGLLNSRLRADVLRAEDVERWLLKH